MDEILDLDNPRYDIIEYVAGDDSKYYIIMSSYGSTRYNTYESVYLTKDSSNSVKLVKYNGLQYKTFFKGDYLAFSPESVL